MEKVLYTQPPLPSNVHRISDLLLSKFLSLKVSLFTHVRSQSQNSHEYSSAPSPPPFKKIIGKQESPSYYKFFDRHKAEMIQSIIPNLQFLLEKSTEKYKECKKIARMFCWANRPLVTFLFCDQ